MNIENNNHVTKKLSLMHPTCGTTLTEQPYCQYCAEPFRDVLLHKDKYISQCNHAYCVDCFAELQTLEKNCTICQAPMQHKIQPYQNNSSRFHAKSKLRSSYSLHFESTQGKLKMIKMNTVSPFPHIEPPINSHGHKKGHHNVNCIDRSILDFNGEYMGTFNQHKSMSIMVEP